MTAQYLLRFDDICPTLNWAIWNEVEAILKQVSIRPLLAVVPDNQDPELDVHPAAADFWERVRGWQSAGWSIGLHGYQHRFATTESGIMGLNAYSEFAGLPREEQQGKLRRAIAILRDHGVVPDLWIAPAHSFDETTLDALVDAGMRKISDGFFCYPHVDRRGLLWVPQQLWRLKPRRNGVWTACYHINRWTTADLMRFRRDVERYRSRITHFEEVCARYAGRRATAFDAAFAGAYGVWVHTLPKLSAVKRAFLRAV